MMDKPLSVDRQSDKIILQGEALTKAMDQGAWSALTIGTDRILITSKKSGLDPDKAHGFAQSSVHHLRDMLRGCVDRQWTGMLLVDTGSGQKRIYFKKGRLCFAASSVMDDRLGEVIYRAEMITLDQLTNTAVQVDRSAKFGQVLLRDQIFSNTSLWSALKAQVVEIFNSIFLAPSVYLEMHAATPATEVVFEQSTDQLIESSYCAGLQFQSFWNRVHDDVAITVVESDRIQSLASGTFLSDMIQLVRKHHVLKDLLDTSKLTGMNTLWVLYRMSCLGFIEFSGLKNIQRHGADGVFTGIKNRVDAFNYLAGLVARAFLESGFSYPTAELQNFAFSLNDSNLAAIYIDQAGCLGADCSSNILVQCSGSNERVRFFEDRLEALIYFVLSMVSDLLPRDKSQRIKAEFLEIAS